MSDEPEQPSSPSGEAPLFRSPPLHLANEVILQRLDGDVWNAIHRLATVVEMHHTALLDLSAADIYGKVKKSANAVRNATFTATKSTYNMYKSATNEIYTAGIENEEDPEGNKYGEMVLSGFPRNLIALLAELAASNDKIKEFTTKLDKNQTDNKGVVAQIMKREEIDLEAYRAHCAAFAEYTSDLKHANDMHKDELTMAKALLAKLQAIKKADMDKTVREQKLQKAKAKVAAATSAASGLRKDGMEAREAPPGMQQEDEQRRATLKEEARKAAADTAAAPSEVEVSSTTTSNPAAKGRKKAPPPPLPAEKKGK